MKIDYEQMAEAFCGDRELCNNFLKLVLQTGPEEMGRIRQGIASGDLEQVRQAAHKLKGSVGYLELSEFQEVVAAVETAGREADAAAAAAHFVELAQRYAEMEAEIRRTLAVESGESQ